MDSALNLNPNPSWTYKENQSNLPVNVFPFSRLNTKLWITICANQHLSIITSRSSPMKVWHLRIYNFCPFHWWYGMLFNHKFEHSKSKISFLINIRADLKWQLYEWTLTKWCFNDCEKRQFWSQIPLDEIWVCCPESRILQNALNISTNRHGIKHNSETSLQRLFSFLIHLILEA